MHEEECKIKTGSITRSGNELNLGLNIENVYGAKGTDTFLLCVFKSLVMFLVCIGTVTGFCDAFLLEYNKTLVTLYALVASIVMGLAFYRKNAIYVAFPVSALIFVLCFKKLVVYVAYGFNEIWNVVQDYYGSYLKMSFEEDDYQLFPEVENKEGMTIAIIFLISILLVLYSITIVRYMNFAETFAITFLVMVIPLYIGRKPGIYSIILIMAGFICTRLLKNGGFDSLKLPLICKDSFIKKRKSDITIYTMTGNYLGILMILGFSLLVSFSVGLVSREEYKKSMPQTLGDSAKDKIDIMVKEVSLNGIEALFEESVAGEGIDEGKLGKLSSINPNLNTDLVVSFVPYGTGTVYLPGYKGIQYTGSSWENNVSTKDFPELGLVAIDYIDSGSFDYIDRIITRQVMGSNASVSAKMQISYVDPNADTSILPYITLPSGIGRPKETFYQPEPEEGEAANDFLTREVTYYPLEYIKYKGDGVYDTYLGGNDNILSNFYNINGMGSLLYFYDYIYDICTDVPKQLDEYLENFLKDRNYLDLDQSKIENSKNIKERSSLSYDIFNSLDNYPENYKEDEGTAEGEGSNADESNDKSENNRNDGDVIILGNSSKYRIIVKGSSDYLSSDSSKLVSSDLSETIIYIPVDSSKNQDEMTDFSEIYDSIIRVMENEKSKADEIEKENEFRQKAGQAIKELFNKEYAYSSAPGRTPDDRDFVEYFLKDQKKGVCTHFATAAVMLLRHMGIPARYREGYCIPHSLLMSKGVELDVDSAGWFNGENEYNPDNKIYSVEVSDYYAHAWVEIYLENKGFVPLDVTPHAYETVKFDPKKPDSSKNIPLAKDNKSKEPTKAPTPTPTVAPSGVAEKSDGNGPTGTKADNKLEEKKEDSAIVKFFKWALETPYKRLAFFGSILILLIILFRLFSKKIYYSIQLMKGNYRKLVYLRYGDLVKKLKKKKVVITENPLPMEVCMELSAYVSGIDQNSNAIKLDTNGNSLMKSTTDYDGNNFRKEIFNDNYLKYQDIFRYIEKILYSDYKTNKKEYKAKIKNIWKKPLYLEE